MKTLRLWLLLLVALSLVLVQCKGDEKKVKNADKQAPKAEKQEAPVAPASEEAQAKEAAEEAADEAADEPVDEAAEEAPAEAAQPAVESEEAGKEGDTAADAEAAEPLTDTVVARVNGEDIDIKDYVERLKKLTKGEVTKAMIKKTVVDRMINDTLLRQETEKLQIAVTDDEVAQAMNMDMERYQKQQEAMGARVKAFRDRVSVRKLLQARGLLKEPSEDELQKEYQRRFGLKIDAVTFPFRKETTEDEMSAMEVQAKEVLEAAKAGVSLRAAIKDKKAPNGRRLIVKPMFIKKGDERHQDLWNSADPLQEKELGGPVKTQHGFVVFQMAKRIEPRKSFEEMKEKLSKSAINMKTAQAKHRLLEDLRQNAQIEYLIEFSKQPALPRLRGMKDGSLSPKLRPAGRDMLRRDAPVRAAPAEAAPTAPAEAAPATAPAE
jgi:hypothetical protein